jgi:hypothetical protein
MILACLLDNDNFRRRYWFGHLSLVNRLWAAECRRSVWGQPPKNALSAVPPEHRQTMAALVRTLTMERSGGDHCDCAPRKPPTDEYSLSLLRRCSCCHSTLRFPRLRALCIVQWQVPDLANLPQTLLFVTPPTLVRAVMPLHVLWTPDVAVLLPTLCPRLHTLGAIYQECDIYLSHDAAARQRPAIMLLLLQRLAHLRQLRIEGHCHGTRWYDRDWADHCTGLLAHLARRKELQHFAPGAVVKVLPTSCITRAATAEARTAPLFAGLRTLTVHATHEAAPMLLAPPSMPLLEELRLLVVEEQREPSILYMYDPVIGDHTPTPEVPPVTHFAASLPPQTHAAAAAQLLAHVAAPRRHQHLRVLALHFIKATLLDARDIVRLGALVQLHTLELRRRSPEPGDMPDHPKRYWLNMALRAPRFGDAHLAALLAPLGGGGSGCLRRLVFYVETRVAAGRCLRSVARHCPQIRQLALARYLDVEALDHAEAADTSHERRGRDGGWESASTDAHAPAFPRLKRLKMYGLMENKFLW